jgi:hypothetical protein
MARSRDATVAFLKSPDPRLRLAAIAIVVNYWRPWEQVTAEVLRLAFEDPEPSIRGAAFVALFPLRGHVIDPTGYLRRLLASVFPLSEAQVAELKRTVKEGEAFASEMVHRISQKLAGPTLANMLESRESAESYLANVEPDLRCAAIVVVGMHWGNTAEFAQVCEKLLSFDTSLKVRLQALAALEGYYSNTDDHRMGDTVARIVYGESYPAELRRAAYRALFSIRGMPTEAFLRAASPTFRFPDDVDWSLVDSFLREGDERGPGANGIKIVVSPWRE